MNMQLEWNNTQEELDASQSSLTYMKHDLVVNIKGEELASGICSQSNDSISTDDFKDYSSVKRCSVQHKFEWPLNGINEAAGSPTNPRGKNIQEECHLTVACPQLKGDYICGDFMISTVENGNKSSMRSICSSKTVVTYKLNASNSVALNIWSTSISSGSFSCFVYCKNHRKLEHKRFMTHFAEHEGCLFCPETEEVLHTKQTKEDAVLAQIDRNAQVFRKAAITGEKGISEGFEYEFRCSGVLITPDTVLTAATCLMRHCEKGSWTSSFRFDSNVEEFFVVIGQTELNNATNFKRVTSPTSIHLHDKLTLHTNSEEATDFNLATLHLPPLSTSTLDSQKVPPKFTVENSNHDVPICISQGTTRHSKFHSSELKFSMNLKNEEELLMISWKQRHTSAANPILNTNDVPCYREWMLDSGHAMKTVKDSDIRHSTISIVRLETKHDLTTSDIDNELIIKNVGSKLNPVDDECYGHELGTALFTEHHFENERYLKLAGLITHISRNERSLNVRDSLNSKYLKSCGYLIQITPTKIIHDWLSKSIASGNLAMTCQNNHPT